MARLGTTGRKNGTSAHVVKLRPHGSQPSEEPAWKSGLKRRGNNILGDERNVLRAFRTAPELENLVTFNEFSLTIELARVPAWRRCMLGDPWSETDAAGVLCWLQEQDIPARMGVIDNAVLLAAKDFSYHPVRQYLDMVRWDGTRRLDDWLVRYLGAQGNAEYLRAIGRCFLISAVARIMQPGCQADHVLVIEGPQGMGKSSAARILATEAKWFAGSLPDIGGKDAMVQLVGKWIIEIAELKAVRSSQLEATKSFITQTVDTFRPPFARHSAQFPRQCVFIATTNEESYLRDRTGNRRYWPAKCHHIDRAALLRDRDQLWAEAVVAFSAGEIWHLDASVTALAEEEQEDRLQVSVVEREVATYLDGLKDVVPPCIEVSVREVLVHGCRLDPHLPTFTESARKLGPEVAEAIKRAGWEKVARRGKSRDTIYRLVDKGDKV